MNVTFSAKAVLPIAGPPLVPGWIEVAQQRVVRTGGGAPPAAATDLGDVAILPGLVNAHTHLELSWMEGRVPPAASMVEWIRALIAARAGGASGGRDEEVAAATRAAMAMRETGTVLVGDISNTLMSPAIVATTGLGATIFHEMLAFRTSDPAAIVREAWDRIDRLVAGKGDDELSPTDVATLSFSVVAHAPYSVSPRLFKAIARARRAAPLAVHLGESPEEIQFLRTGGGPFRELLDDLGAFDDAWACPGCDPVEYLERVGYLRAGLLAVHAVHLEDPALERLRDAGGAVVTCPRSNAWVGAGLPRVAHFYNLGVPVAIGTDSLASASSLNLFDEMAELRRIAPDVSAASILESATRVGAEVLGFGADYGTLAPGKRAALIAVDLPAGTGDVEEYLVSGVPAGAVRRLPPG